MYYIPRLLVTTIACLTFFALSNCSLIDNGDGSNAQTYYFEVEYVNHAWGYQHNGFYIDKTGDVFAYNYNEQDDPWNPETRDHFTVEELVDKYSHSNSLCDKIDFITLKEKQLYIPIALAGNISDTTSDGADMGTLSYICYRYNSNSNLYTPIILQVSGDIAFKNESEAAENLVLWLGTLCQLE
ncbi:MAG: hypothetical protein PVF17_05495 [Ignavibacteria bacterium]|jgi:hypothetical protein